MRGLLIIANLLVLVCCASPTRADDEQDLRGEVDRLVQELDANQLARRQAAEQALVALGPAIRPLLPPVTPRMAAEVKERLGRVRTALEMAVAESAAQPSLVTLHGEMPLAEALKELEKQTGNRIEGIERAGGTAKLDFEQVPYWEAVDRLLDKADLGIDPYGGMASALVLSARSEMQSDRFGQAVYAGVFRFAVQRLEAIRDFANPAVNTMRLTLNISWEPRVTPILLRQPQESLVLKDERGEAIVPSGSRPAYAAAPAEFTMSETELVIPLALPDREATKIALLKGAMTALIPGSKETFEFGQLASARGVEKRVAGVTVTLDRVRKNGDAFEVRMRARYENAGEALQSNRSWIYHNEAFLVDAAGKQVDPVSFSSGGRSRDEIQLNYLFPVDEIDGYSFRYRTPAAMLRVPVEFELRDIPLP